MPSTRWPANAGTVASVVARARGPARRLLRSSLGRARRPHRRQVDPERRRITVDRQVVETRCELRESLPKGRRRRVTMYPARTPAGVALGELVQRRLHELGDPAALMFPAPRGGWHRRSNYGRNLLDPACEFIGWPKAPD